MCLPQPAAIYLRSFPGQRLRTCTRDPKKASERIAKTAFTKAVAAAKGVQPKTSLMHFRVTVMGLAKGHSLGLVTLAEASLDPLHDCSFHFIASDDSTFAMDRPVNVPLDQKVFRS
jgi:hypothetical protein